MNGMYSGSLPGYFCGGDSMYMSNSFRDTMQQKDRSSRSRVPKWFTVIMILFSRIIVEESVDWLNEYVRRIL
jgi:hypothetical protein